MINKKKYVKLLYELLGLILTILLGLVSTNSSSFCNKIIHLKGRGLKIEKYVLRYSKGITSVSQPENRNVYIAIQSGQNRTQYYGKLRHIT